MRWLIEVATTIISNFMAKIHTNPSDTHVYFMRIHSYTSLCIPLEQQRLSRSGPQIASVSILPINGNYVKILN